MGTLFLIFPLSKNIDLKSYKLSVKFLSASYFTLAVLNIIILFNEFVYDKPEFFDFTLLLLSSLQALLFTLVILFNPQFVIRKYQKI